jgi:prepilin-type processing-associated H-X9-DG protein
MRTGTPVNQDGAFRHSWDATTWFYGRHLAGINNPARFMLFIDAATRGTGYGEPQNLDYGDPWCGNVVDSTGRANRGGAIDKVWLAHPKDTCNVLFADCHAETNHILELKAIGITHYWDNRGLVH